MLLAKRTKPPLKWSFPGGGIETGESAEGAAIREAREEVSVEIEILGKAGVREITLSYTFFPTKGFQQAASAQSATGKAG